MTKGFRKTVLIGYSSFLFLTFTLSAQTVDNNPHLISKTDSNPGCASCHIELPIIGDNKIVMGKNLPVDWSKFNQDDMAMCPTCHAANIGHKIGLPIDFPIPADMPLGKNNTLTCLTCHYMHGRLDSDRPQASFSFMDRLMGSERPHKSFLLRRNNRDGELCLTCHSANPTSKS